MKATVNKGFWVKYGDNDLNFLEIGTPSADAYSVYDNSGKKICSLTQYYKKLMGK